MSIHLDEKDLANIQRMEVAVNGPDGATHLILCVGVADLGTVSHETYTFLVGPQLTRRQFVSVIAWGSISTIQAYGNHFSEIYDRKAQLDANFLLIAADFDDEAGQVKVRADVSLGAKPIKLAISYYVNILAELPST
jgi:hypothetical protein